MKTKYNSHKYIVKLGVVLFSIQVLRPETISIFDGQLADGLVINPVVGCHDCLPGPCHSYLGNPTSNSVTTLWLLPNTLLGERATSV